MLFTTGGASFLLRIAGMAATFLTGVLLARVLGPADYGRYGLVITLTTLGMTIALLGTPQLAVRELSVRKSRGDVGGVRQMSGLMLRITLLGSLALGGATIAVALVSGVPGSEFPVYLLAAVLIAGGAVTAQAAAQLRGLGQLMRGQFFENVGRPGLGYLVLLTILFAGHGLTASSAILVQAAVTIAAATISLWWVRAALPLGPTPNRARAVPWLAAALPLGAVDILRTFDGSYGLVLMDWLASDIELGIYRVALACLTLLTLPGTVFHIALAPRLARLIEDAPRSELQALLRQVSGLLTAGMLVAALLVYLWGEALIVLAFGADYAAAWQPIMVLSIAQAVFGIFGMGPIMLAMGGGERTLTRIYVVAVLAGVASAVPLISMFGASGAAAAQLVSLLLIGVQSEVYTRRRWLVGLTFLGRPVPSSA